MKGTMVKSREHPLCVYNCYMASPLKNLKFLYISFIHISIYTKYVLQVCKINDF